jgi:hypothetical protein
LDNEEGLNIRIALDKLKRYVGIIAGVILRNSDDGDGGDSSENSNGCDSSTGDS